MAEHWKSTPRYWCKHCSTYVRDTALERRNHEATGKHQGAVKRSLRELHRGKEAEERERERAKREIDRLNGVVGGSTAGPSSGARSSRPVGGAPLSESERKRQAEQLAGLGVSIPQEFRGDLAMVGEWAVTSTTVVEDKPKEGYLGSEARARGVHKRERTEEEKEEEDAVRGLFKKPRRWGRDSKTVGGEASEDLDALLSGGLVVKKDDDDDADAVKKEAGAEATAEGESGEAGVDDVPSVKKEPSHEEDPIPADIPAGPVGPDKADLPLVKAEERDEALAGVEAPVVAFKKRKPKNIRQK